MNLIPDKLYFNEEDFLKNKQMCQIKRLLNSVLKFRFNYYSGMVRSTDQDMIAIEMTVCYSVSKRREHTPHHTAPHGEAPGLVRRQREQGGNIEKSSYCDFPRKEHVKQGKQV